MIKRFILNYIRRSMAHEYMTERNDIFTAINEGMEQTFTEDNLQGRLSYATYLVLINNKDFRKVGGSTTHAAMIRSAITDSVEEALD